MVTFIGGGRIRLRKTKDLTELQDPSSVSNCMKGGKNSEKEKRSTLFNERYNYSSHPFNIALG